jgi:hypothetical protein
MTALCTPEIEALLTVKFRQPSHQFTFGVGMNFISYPLVLTPLGISGKILVLKERLSG